MDQPILVPIYVNEGNDPTLLLRFVELVDGELVAYAISGTLEAVVKATPNTDDDLGSTIAEGANLIQTGGGTATLLLTAEQVGAPGVKWLRVDEIVAGRRMTIGKGPLVVENV